LRVRSFGHGPYAMMSPNKIEQTSSLRQSCDLRFVAEHQSRF